VPVDLLTKRPPEAIDWGTPTPAPRPRRELGRPRWAATLGAVVVVGTGLGYLGWVLPGPGGSVVFPTVAVCGVGVVFVVVAAALNLALPKRRFGWLLPVGIAVMTVTASIWTWQFSLAASINWSNTPTLVGRALAGAEGAPGSPDGTFGHPCATVTSGHAGPLAAPYLECATVNPQGKAIVFTAGQGPSVHGLAFVEGGSGWFADQCSHHVLGPWWTFRALTDGTGGCPFGYRFNAGG
jgi:hypothetical protein